MKCEIILTGNELLIGKIVETNGKFIIDQIIPLGAQISRITTIPDNLTDITATIQQAIARSPDYIFTSGGLGPTFDDMTLLGIANGLSPAQPLEENGEALYLVKRYLNTRYPTRSFEEAVQRYPYLMKMVQLPAGSHPLSNSKGTAPGVYIPADFTNHQTIIIAMPGIPEELQAIFTDHVLPEIQKKMVGAHFYECGFRFSNLGESRFTEKIYEIKDKFPDLWIKTHPRRGPTSKQWEIELHITSFDENPLVIDHMREVYSCLRQHVIDTKGIILSESPLDNPQ
ncbi:MAG: competence/damage-inducible protein A [Promethearchaeota archaeon]